jgi:hypothetical protein
MSFGRLLMKLDLDPTEREALASPLLDKIDIWHMSSCGFVPSSMESFDMEYGVNERFGFYAYDWDSNRASEEDIVAWFEAANRRTKEWVEKYEDHYSSVNVYLRDGSKSKKCWSYYINNSTIFNAYLSQYSTDFEEAMTNLTMGGRYGDADLPLLHPERLSYLAITLFTALRRTLRR